MTGKFPYEASHSRMIPEIEKKQRSPLPTTYSSKLRDLVDKMLTIDPRKRITISKLLHELGIADFCVQQVIEA
jgi:serine/threonine protein kinase